MPGLAAAGARALTGRDVLGLLAIAAGAGALLGVAWWMAAPRVVLEVFGDAAFPAEFQPGGYIADDGIAALACVSGGIITMAVAAILARRHGGLALRSSTLGWALLAGAVGAVVLWWTGSQLGAVDVAAQIAAVGDGGAFEAPLTLRMPGVLVLWPLASAAAFALGSLVTWIIHPGEQETTGPVSRSLPAPPA